MNACVRFVRGQELQVRGGVEFIIIIAPLRKFHQVVAEEAHGDHDAVFVRDVQRFFHVGDGVRLKAGNEVRAFVECGARAHVVEEPPADDVSACGAGAFDAALRQAFSSRAASPTSEL